MKLIKLIQIALTVTLTTFSCAIFADKTTLDCPTIDLVTQVSEQVDNAIPDGQFSYIVTSKPIIPFADRLWSVRTTVPARSQEDAVKLAQIVVKDAKTLMTPTAIKIFDQYGCVYFSARAYVYALAGSN